MMSAKEPAMRAAGTPAPMLTAPPVWVAEGAAWVDETTSGVEVAVTLVMLELGVGVGVGVAVIEFTRIKVLVMVAVDTEMVSSAAAKWAAARQRTEVMRAPNCILANKMVETRDEMVRKRWRRLVIDVDSSQKSNNAFIIAYKA